jgi:hypothetical protein
MKVFYWYSTAFEGHGPGRILVIAETVEEARKQVMADAGQAFLKKRFWLDDGWLLQLVSEDDMEDYREFLTKLRNDIATEPKVTTETVFIRGSD